MDEEGRPAMAQSVRFNSVRTGLRGTDGPRGWRGIPPIYGLLPLRVFLGVTFIYAGIDKLTTPGFFQATGPNSVGAMMTAVRDGAAIPGLVDLALKSPAGFGYAIALGELAVGIGIFFGILGRIAAAGGALISLSLWLTVSWSATPYYYGNDLAYLMGWLPLVLLGTPVLSVDSLWPGLGLRRRRAL
jgi:thiosulfate dehydrogenase [quinone] large subunit